MKDYHIEKINKKEAEIILNKFHYLSKQGFGFRSNFNYGLFLDDKLIGITIYHTLSVPETAKGMFGLERDKQSGIYELGRLALDPHCYEKNLTSWFLSRTIKLLKQETQVKCILSYADSDFHNGYIYQATNFKYYGLTDKKKDFYILQDDGSYKKHQRGKIKGLSGEWRDRSRKHRYLILFDKELKKNIKWKQINWKEEDKYN
jgi:hypothetical protein